MKMKFNFETTIVEFMNNLSGCVPYENHFIDVWEIEHKRAPGFIPFTNGGYVSQCITDLKIAYGSGSYPAVIQQYIDNDLQDALQSFKDENPDIILDNDEIPDGDDKERYYEYEDEYMSEGGSFCYELRVVYYNKNNSSNVSGEDEIYIVAGVNTDFEYMRDSGLVVSFERTIPVGSIENEDYLINAMQDAINSI